MTTNELIKKLNEPLAVAIALAGYHFAGESETDTHCIFEFNGDGPKIEVYIEKVCRWYCPTCTKRFDEPYTDNDGDCCPGCSNREIIRNEEVE